MTLFKKIAAVTAMLVLVIAPLTAFSSIKATEAKVCNGIKLSFNSECANGDSGNFWLNEFGRNIFFTDNEKRNASVTFANNGDSDVKVIFRGVSSDWANERFSKSETIPSNGAVTVEVYDIKNLENTDNIYFYLEGIMPNSEITFKVNYANVDYSSLTAASMQGNGKFSVSKVEKDSVKLTCSKTTGVKYTVALDGSVFAFARNVDEFEHSFATGEKIKVYLTLEESVKDAFKGISVNGDVNEGTNISLTVEADSTVKAVFGKMSKLSRGLTAKFYPDLDNFEGNLYFNQVNIKDLLINDGKISVTVFNESNEKFSAGAFVVNGEWKRIGESKIEEVMPGEYKTFDLENIKFENNGEIFYVYLEDIKASTRLRVLFNGANVDYSVFTSYALSGLDVPPFEVSAEQDDSFTVKVEKSDRIKYNIYANGSKIPLLNNIEEGEMSFVKGTDVKVSAIAENGYAVSAWEKDSTKISANGEIEIKSINADVILKAFSQKSNSDKANSGDYSVSVIATFAVLSAVAVAVLSRKKYI